MIPSWWEELADQAASELSKYLVKTAQSGITGKLLSRSKGWRENCQEIEGPTSNEPVVYKGLGLSLSAEVQNADKMYPHFCSGNDHSIFGPTMIGIATAMIGLRGREFFHGLAPGFRRTQNHCQVTSD